jgi:uncharacterized protein DUF29
MTDAKNLYERDFIAWAKQQAGALRAAASGGSTEQLDWENLAEEVEGLGVPERRALHSQIRCIICHLLKLEFSPGSNMRRSWAEAVNGARSEIELVLEMSPSLRSEIGVAIETEHGCGARLAIRDMEEYDELDLAAISKISAVRYTEDQILGDWFPPDPTRSPGRR